MYIKVSNHEVTIHIKNFCIQKKIPLRKFLFFQKIKKWINYVSVQQQS
jgi:hypothetical protein